MKDWDFRMNCRAASVRSKLCELQLPMPYAAYFVTTFPGNSFLSTINRFTIPNFFFFLYFKSNVTALCKQCPPGTDSSVSYSLRGKRTCKFLWKATYTAREKRDATECLVLADSANLAVMHGLCAMTKQQYTARSGSPHARRWIIWLVEVSN